MEKTKGMTTCKICGREFPLLIEDHYISKEASKTGFASLVNGSVPAFWDSFDCPHCGCQNRVQPRNCLSNIMGQDLSLGVDDEADEESEFNCGCCDTNSYFIKEEQ